MSWVIYKQIEFIRVICRLLFLLTDDTHGFKLSTKDMYEAEVYVFIYSYTWC